MDTNFEKSSKLYQILCGKYPEKKKEFLLLDWEPLIDVLLSFYDTYVEDSKLKREKALQVFLNRYGNSMNELKKLRMKKSDFEIVKTIGKGFFGEVHVVKERSTEEIYAMKVLNKASTLSQDNVSFFFEEKEVMAYASGEWVTKLFYSFMDNQNLYLVMEYLAGGDLLCLLNKYDDEVMDQKSASFYLSEIIIATNCVHKAGYAHRDIKPENILIDITGHIKLADFGSAARLINGTHVLGKMPVGTPDYIAPEVLTCADDTNNRRYGKECDYWSVGVVAYEMLYGILPFEATSVLQLYSKIMNFKETFEFPDDVEVTEEARSLISGLICDSSERFSYSTLAKHHFFKDYDWTTIKSVAPPHVPNVTSKVDTSNFDNVQNPKTQAPRATAKGNSLIQDLPFFGYTFTRPLFQSFQNDLRTLTAGSIVSDAETSNLQVGSTSLNNSLSIYASSEKSNVGLSNLKKELENANKQLESYKATINESNQNLEKTMNEKNNATEEVTRLTKMYNELKSNLEGINEKKTELNQNFGEFIEDLNLAIKLEIPLTAELTQVLDSIKSRFQQVKSEEGVNLDKITNLQKDLVVLKENMNKLNEDNKAKEEAHQKSSVEYQETISNLKKHLDETTQNSNSKIEQLQNLNIKANEVIDSLKEKTNQLELLLSNMSNKNVQSSENSLEIEDLRQLNNDLAAKYNSANSICEEMKEKLKIAQKELFEENKTNEDIKQQLFSLTQSNKEMNFKLENATLEIQKLKKMEEAARTTQTDLNQTIENLNAANKSLLKENEHLKEEVEIKLKQENRNNDILAKKLETANQKLEQATSQLSNISNSQVGTDSKIKSLENENEQYKIKYISEKISKDDLQKKIDSMISTMQAQKESNYTLLEEIDTLKNSIENKNVQIERLTYTLEQANMSLSVSQTRSMETISQQTKLIQFLQQYISKSKKKKNKLDTHLIEGPMSGISALSNDSGSKKITELENKLKIEVEANMKTSQDITGYQNEITKLKKYINSLKLDLERVSNNASSNASLTPSSILNRGNSISRLSLSNTTKSNLSLNDTVSRAHDIHRVLACSSAWCYVCMNPICTGIEILVCSYCKLTMHTHCEDSNIFNCTHNIFAWMPLSPLSKTLESICYTWVPLNLPLSNWVEMINANSIHSKPEWESRWITLTSNQLLLYKDEITSDMDETKRSELLCESYNFSNGDISVHPLTQTSELVSTIGVSGINMVWVFETPVNYRATFKRIKNLKPILYFKSTTADDKIYWLSAFRQIQRDYYPKKVNKHIATNFVIQKVANLPTKRPPRINCSISLTEFNSNYPNILLIGSYEGFGFVFVTDPAVYMRLGHFGNIEMMILFKDRIIFTHGSNRSVCIIETKIFNEYLKNEKWSGHDSASKYVCLDLADLADVHIMRIKKVDKMHILAVSANSKIVIYKFNSSYQFTKLTEIDVNGPVLAMLINETSVVYSTNKYYSINLKTFGKTEFLDSKDHTIAYVSFSASATLNYPIAIFPIKSGKVEEYILCFSEFGIVVNDQGKRSRKGEINWSKVPISFYKSANFLVAVHYDCLSVLDLDDFSSNHGAIAETTKKFDYFYLNSPQPLAENKNKALFITGFIDDSTPAYFIIGHKSTHNQFSVLESTSPSSKEAALISKMLPLGKKDTLEI